MTSFGVNQFPQPTRHSVYRYSAGVPLLNCYLRFTSYFNTVSLLLLRPSPVGVHLDQREGFRHDYIQHDQQTLSVTTGPPSPTPGQILISGFCIGKQVTVSVVTTVKLIKSSISLESFLFEFSCLGSGVSGWVSWHFIWCLECQDKYSQVAVGIPLLLIVYIMSWLKSSQTTTKTEIFENGARTLQLSLQAKSLVSAQGLRIIL